jgi:hypothetical protein
LEVNRAVVVDFRFFTASFVWLAWSLISSPACSPEGTIDPAGMAKWYRIVGRSVLMQITGSAGPADFHPSERKPTGREHQTSSMCDSRIIVL